MPGQAVDAVPTAGLPQPNLKGHVGRPLRYRPDHGDFVIENGQEFFNRSLYGGNTAFRVDGGDKPEFSLYLPGRGGNLRLGFRNGGTLKWLKDAAQIVTRYRPGELLYEIRDPGLGAKATLTVEVLANADTEGVMVRIQANGTDAGGQLLWAYGGVNGQRGVRDGDLGTEKVPISQYFQLQPQFAAGNVFELSAQGFTLKSPHANIVGVVPAGSHQYVSDAGAWNDLSALMSQGTAQPKRPVVVGYVPLSATALLLSLQRVNDGKAGASDLAVYRDVTTAASGSKQADVEAPLLPAFERAKLPFEFAAARAHFEALRNRVRVETPDPYLDAAVASLNVTADALWDTNARAIMHGAIAWRTKLLGWRGAYTLDELGWHDRARENFETWMPRQNTSPIPAALPSADPKANLARNEPGLHSNGDLSNSHYDMNMVFIDALFRHLLWTGDAEFARAAWPVIERHLAWERRLFRREYGPSKLPLYEPYAAIWASDDLYYSGGGTAYASAYNLYANRMAARLAVLAGTDPTPYTVEADLIAKGMHELLWLPDEGTYAECKDSLGRQLVHTDYGLWNFYHTVDEQAVTPRKAWLMGSALEAHMRPIPVEGPGVPHDRPYHVFSETDWMPYSWSINNVVMDENMHTALALWEGGHSEDAFTLVKGSLLASMYMGIAPGNVGTMNYLDVYRRESQRDFGDRAGTMSRAIVEGLFGVHPDALAGTLTLSPGLPAEWGHARLTHPDVGVEFVREGRTDTWTIRSDGKRFRTLTLLVPAVFTNVSDVRVNGRAVPWSTDAEAAGRPVLKIVTPVSSSVRIQIHWSGKVVTAGWMSNATTGATEGKFERASSGKYSWWRMRNRAKVAKAEVNFTQTMDWQTPRSAAQLEAVDLTSSFNDRVDAIFAKGKYLAPRSPGVSLEQPWQGVGAWAGHLNELPKIDDSGLRRVAGEHGGKVLMPNGVFFTTPSAAGSKNIVFTSQWKNYQEEVVIPLTGRASRAYLLMAGSTNFMQSHMETGEVRVTYTDGHSDRLALRNPETWWPIEQDYFIDDYQFALEGALPPRVDLKTGTVRVLSLPAFKGKGAEVPGGAATVLTLPLDRGRTLRSVTVSTFTNDSIIGLMGVTLERP